MRCRYPIKVWLHAIVLSFFLLYVMVGWHQVAAPQRIRPFVTFIIPSKGRSTLPHTLASLCNITNPAWTALVLFDGVPFNASSPPSSDRRVRYLSLPKSGTANHAGHLRNFGMGMANTTWLAFVDDDDFLSNTYVDRLLEESQREPTADCIMFRMYDSRKPSHILPPPSASNFVFAQVGISFAMRKRLYDLGFFFIPGIAEDFVLLDKIRAAGKKMLLSEYLTYFVRAPPHLPDNGNYTRGVLN